MSEKPLHFLFFLFILVLIERKRALIEKFSSKNFCGKRIFTNFAGGEKKEITFLQLLTPHHSNDNNYQEYQNKKN